MKGEREIQKDEWNWDESGGGLRDEGRHPVINSHILTNTRIIVLDTNTISSLGLIARITPSPFI